MQRITDIIKGAFRWLPNQYRSYRQSNQEQCVPVLCVTKTLDSNQTKQLKEQLNRIKNIKKAPAIALLVDNC